MDKQVVDRVVKHVVKCSPKTVISPVIEEKEWDMVLEWAVCTSVQNELDQLQTVGLKRRWDAFQRVLQDNLPAREEFMRVVIKSDVRPVNARPRIHFPAKAVRIVACMNTLMVMELVVLQMQAVWASWTMVVPNYHGYRLRSDYCAISGQIENASRAIPDPEAGI